MKTGRKNARNSKKINLGSGDDIFLKNFGKIHKFWNLESRSPNFRWSLGLEFQVSVTEFLMKPRIRSFNEVSVSKVTVSTTSLLFSVANAKRKHNWNWSVKYLILRVRFNKISLFRMLLTRFKSHWITTIFRWCGTKFFLRTSMQNYTIWQHYSIAPVW